MKYVQFADSTQTKVIAVFTSVQNATQYPNQGTIADDDARYLDFENSISGTAVQAIKKRNYLLTLSDWTQIPGNPLTSDVQTQWATYRQALRDVPAQSGFPNNINWPVAPTTT